MKFLPYLTQETVHEFDEGDNKFQHMLRELESVRKQAYEDNCSREKAERELFEAFQKVSSLICIFQSCQIYWC